MRLLTATIPDDADVVFAGDFHEGAQASYTKGIKALVKWIAAKSNRFLIHKGDGIEAVAVDDKRFSAETLKRYSKAFYGETVADGEVPKDEVIATPVAQALAHAEMLAPIADQMLLMLMGNHEATLKRFGNLTKLMLSPRFLNRPGIYGGRTAKLRLNNEKGEQICKIFAAHPSRVSINSNAKDYEQRIANMKACLKMKLVRKASDCLIMSLPHTHKLLVVPPARKLLMFDDGEGLRQEYLGQGDGRARYIEPDQRWYLNTGSFLKTQELDIDSYSEEAFYDPTEIGYCIAKFREGVLVDIEGKVI